MNHTPEATPIFVGHNLEAREHLSCAKCGGQRAVGDLIGTAARQNEPMFLATSLCGEGGVTQLLPRSCPHQQASPRELSNGSLVNVAVRKKDRVHAACGGALLAHAHPLSKAEKHEAIIELLKQFADVGPIISSAAEAFAIESDKYTLSN